jgi:hypothetical protein
LELQEQLSALRLPRTGKTTGRNDAGMMIVILAKKIALPNVGTARERNPRTIGDETNVIVQIVTTAKRNVVRRIERRTLPRIAKTRNVRSVAMMDARRLEMSDVKDAAKKDVANEAMIDMMTKEASAPMVGTSLDARKAKLLSLKFLWIRSNTRSTTTLSPRQTTSQKQVMVEFSPFQLLLQ